MLSHLHGANLTRLSLVALIAARATDLGLAATSKADGDADLVEINPLNRDSKGNLIALRELALRVTAHHVDAEMRHYMRDHAIRRTWPVRERLLVCIGPSPSSVRLLRAAKRMAEGLEAEWIVAYVETPAQMRLPQEARDRVAETMRLAEELRLPLLRSPVHLRRIARLHQARAAFLEDGGKRGIALHLGKQCTRVDDDGSQLTVHFGDGETVQCDLMLVSVGRAPLVEGLGLEEIGVQLDRRAGIATDEHRRTTVPHIYAVGDCAGYWQLAHTAFREGEVAAENACGHEATIGDPAVPRPIYTDPEIAGVGLTEAQARERHGDDVAVGTFPWVANARAVMQAETVGWVKSIHETRYGELLGLVMVGPHVTDLVEAGVVAIDAEATVETVADGMTAHPTLSEAIKEAGLVALGRPIHVATRRRAAATT